jgi:hypothetical protein
VVEIDTELVVVVPNAELHGSREGQGINNGRGSLRRCLEPPIDRRGAFLCARTTVAVPLCEADLCPRIRSTYSIGGARLISARPQLARTWSAESLVATEGGQQSRSRFREADFCPYPRAASDGASASIARLLA